VAIPPGIAVASCDDRTVGSAEGPGLAAERARGSGKAGIVARTELFDRLAGPARVTVVSAPPGSGKSVLLRSWIAEAGLDERAAWVPGGHDGRDPQPFWVSVLGALAGTGPGSSLVQALTAAPDLDGWAIAERLLTDLAPLEDQIWLIIDDVQELGPEALRQLELLVLRAPPLLRIVLATRHDVRLGLHRLRLEGGLAEIREPDLRFTVAEAAELFAAARLELPEPAVAMLHERTEGWAAGLRLAALSLSGHPDPEQFAAGFSGSERTVAEYLLAEVLDRQPEPVRRLLLRTSVLERVNGELADLLTGGRDGERTLQDLEEANAFVVSLDPARTWFRYHQMFAGLLRLELRRAGPGEVTGLHQAASRWFAGHGYPAEAIRHAQQAQDWELAARLLADHWPGFHLDGQAAAVHELLAGFPPAVRAADAELAAVTAGDELAHGSLEAARRYLGLAERGLASVPDARHAQAHLLLEIARLLLARQGGDLPAVAEQTLRLQTTADDHDPAHPNLSQDLRVLALIGLDSPEVWTARFQEAERHLDQGAVLARQIGRPYLEFSGLAHLATIEIIRSYARAADHCRQAIELAERHGWTDASAAGTAYMTLGSVLTWQGRLEQAEPWIQRAERTVKPQAQPVAGMGACFNRAALELGRGRDADALTALQAAERLGGLLAAPNAITTGIRAFQLLVQVRLGETGNVERALAGFDDRDYGCGELRMALAALRLSQDDPPAATAALAPVLDGATPLIWPAWLVQAFLLDASAKDAIGDRAAAGQALERALDCAEPDGVLLPFLLQPLPGLLNRQAGHRTAHAALIAEILGLLAGNGAAPPPTGPRPLTEPLRDSELRVLRYLPTNLTGPEIAAELYLSPHTVKTHLRNLYAKLGTHHRSEAVARARELGMLAPSALRDR
jgi:LuxR family transcriptional regulator, maltose regulon positive regulatory protein